jgi:hypothetical protein
MVLRNAARLAGPAAAIAFGPARPLRYVGAAEVQDDGEPFEEKIARLIAELEEQFAERARLEAAIRDNLKWLAATQPLQRHSGGRESTKPSDLTT